MADMRQQVGLYVLHDDWGVYYVGLTIKRTLGQRIKDHLDDAHKDRWDRFSWFGFREVLRGQNEHGLCRLRSLPASSVGNPEDAIRDMEALLIYLHNPRGNQRTQQFQRAQEWTQVAWHEREMFFNRL
jgi:hypothetical protein